MKNEVITLDLIEDTLSSKESGLFVEWSNEGENTVVKHNANELVDFANELNDYIQSYEFEEADFGKLKKQRTAINNLVKKCDRIRIDNVKEFTKPISEFEDKMKEAALIFKTAESKYKTFVDEKKAETTVISEIITKINVTLEGDIKVVEKAIKALDKIDGLGVTVFKDADYIESKEKVVKEEIKPNPMW